MAGLGNFPYQVTSWARGIKPYRTAKPLVDWFFPLPADLIAYSLGQNSTISSDWTASGNALLTSNVLQLTTSLTATTESITTVGTTYDIRDRSAFVQVVSVGNQALLSKEVGLEARANGDASNSVYIAVESSILSGNIVARRRLGGVVTTLGSAAYNPEDMQWWRIREDDGTVYWEYAQDSQGPYTIIAQEVNKISLGAVSFRLYVTTTILESLTTSISLSNFNVPTSALSWASGSAGGRR